MENHEKKVYNLDDVAQELGVSKTTVSRAISGKGRIGAATREKVLRFIREHDYRPSVVARGLAQKKTYNIGLVLPMDYAVTDMNFFKECMNGVWEAASERDYDILITMQEGEELAGLRRLVQNRKVDGIILTRTTESRAPIEFLQESGSTFLVIGPTEDKTVPSVDNQNREGGRELTELLIGKGFQRLALFGGERTHRVSKSRYDGFCGAYREKGLPLKEELIFWDLDSRTKIEEALKRVMAGRADGIVCMDDHIAGLTADCARSLGVRIPDELVLAGMYDSPELELEEISVTAVHFDTKELGKKAACTLLSLLGEQGMKEQEGENYRVIWRSSTERRKDFV